MSVPITHICTHSYAHNSLVLLTYIPTRTDTYSPGAEPHLSSLPLTHLGLSPTCPHFHSLTWGSAPPVLTHLGLSPTCPHSHGAQPHLSSLPLTHMGLSPTCLHFRSLSWGSAPPVVASAHSPGAEPHLRSHSSTPISSLCTLTFALPYIGRGLRSVTRCHGIQP